ncbi:hypothetical protein A1F94_006715 [Pyrenophora tritici-repentis]|uniref:Uncharacterized protein n=1 Tax=Pyrenophora tritici-repentis TaxID=45151 RepID=A0A317AN33_9PLEO|nr:hypothetical protein PtrM4_118550 [Pyrenophora tritici-repentis]KAG9382794.1 hypothetical protein A1F94_006715 [Pyrenophora tritici-repentis]KAI1510427.1 hypothetical protein Ptr86124_010873 [Pyrenophora tritici-repentis]KAI1680777.1 hypothetical protein KJE20_09628 [Pyrenophora tritici-repentis]
MAVELLAVKAALETISRASCNSLISSTRELCKANAAIAKALLYLSQSGVSDTDRVEVEVGGNISSEHADLANLQTQPYTASENDTAQDEAQSILKRYKAQRCRPDHAVVRLAQYWIQRKLTGSSFCNVGDADEHRLLVDLRKAVVLSTPAVLSLLRGIKRKRSIDST